MSVPDEPSAAALEAGEIHTTYAFDGSGKLLHIGSGTRALLGYPASGPPLLQLSELHAQSGEVEALLHWLGASAQARTTIRKTVLRHASGSTLNVELHITAVPGAEGVGPRAYCSLRQDQREQVRDLLHEVRHIVDKWENAPCGYHSLDPQGRIQEINATELRWLGLPREQAIGRPMSDFYTPQGRALFARSFPRFIAEGHVDGLEFDLVASDGSVRHVSVSGTMVSDAKGQFAGTRSVMYDISELVRGRTELSHMVQEQSRLLQELRQREASLTASEFRWKFALEGASDGIWDWDLARNQIDFSAPLLQTLGYAPEDPPPSLAQWRDCIHADDRTAALQVLTDYLNNQSSIYNVEYRVRCKNGSYKWLLSRGVAVQRDADARPLRMIGTLKDISERVKVQTALEESESRLRAITDNTRTVIFMKDLQGRYLHVNRQFEYLMRISAADALGKTDYDLFPKVLADAFQANDRQVIQAARPFEMEELVPGPEGMRTYLSVKVPLRDAQGQIYSICGMATDITERKATESELRVAGVAFESQIAMLITDAAQKIQRVNSAFSRDTGYSASDVMGQSPQLLYAQAPSASVLKSMQQALASQGSWQGETQGRRKNGETYSKLLNITAVKNETGEITHYVESELDISGLKRAEQAQIALNRELTDSRRLLRQLAAKKEALLENERKHVAREVHDELGQIMTALRMEMSLFQIKFGALSEDMPAKISAIKALVDRAIEAVRNVASNLRPTALDMGLLAAIEWLGSDFQQRTGLRCQIDVPQPIADVAEAVAVATFRVVQESLTNITRHAQASRVDISVTAHNGKLCVDIRDDGVGFAVASTKSKKTFGLLGMQERVLVHQGAVDIQSGPGQGTRIRIAMPLNNKPENPHWEE